jgi:hypothetical protein
MKSAFLLVLAALLIAACIFFSYRASDLLTTKEYVGGLVHAVIGLALAKGAIELARIAVLARPRGAS